MAAFERFVHGKDEDVSLRSKRGAVAMLLAAGLSAGVSWGLAETWLSGYDGWSLFWRAGIIGWIGVQIGIAGAGTITGFGAGFVAGVVIITGVVTGAVVGAVAVAVVIAEAGAGGVALAVVIQTRSDSCRF